MASDDQTQMQLQKLQILLLEASRVIGRVSSTSSSSDSSSSAKRIKRVDDDYIDAMSDLTNSLEDFNDLQEKQNDLSKSMVDITAKNITEVKKGGKIVARTVEVSKTHAQAIDDYNKNARAASALLRVQTQKSRELSNKTLPQLIAHQKATQELIDSNKALASHLKQSQQLSSVYNAALLQHTEQMNKGGIVYKSYVAGLSRAAKGMGTNLLDNLGLLDETTKAIKDNLDPEDFAKLRITLGKTQDILGRQLSGLGLGTPADLKKIASAENGIGNEDKTRGGTAVTDAIKAAAMEMVTTGHDIGLGVKGVDEHGKITTEAAAAIGGMKPEDLQKLLGTMLELQEKAKAVADEMDRDARLAQTSIGRMTLAVSGAAQKVKEFGLVASIAEAAIEAKISEKGFAMMKEGATRFYHELVDFNVSGIVAGFADVQFMSMKLGMSFEDTVKFLHDNQRTLGLYGASGFKELNSQLGSTFKQFGYNLKQSAAMVGPAISEAASAGINIQKGDQLNSYIDSSMKAFDRIRGIVNITGEEYLKLNTELAKTTETSRMLIGLSQTQAVAYLDNLKAERDDLVVKGIEIQTAQKMVQDQERARHAPVRERVENAAKLGMAMRMQGASQADISRAMRLTMMGQMVRDKGDQEWLAEQQRSVGVAATKREANATSIGQLFGAELTNSFMHQSGAAGEVEDSGLALEAAKRAGLDATGRQAAIQKEQTGSTLVASAGNFGNTASAIAQNALAKAAWGAVAGIGAFTLSAFTSAGMMKRGGLLGGGGGMLNDIWSKLRGGSAALPAAEAAAEAAGGAGAGVAAKAVEKAGLEGTTKAAEKVGAKALGKSLLKKIPVIGLLAGLGFGLKRVLDGDMLGAGMEVASGAASTIPGLGTAASIGIDAGLAGRDIYNATNPEGAPGPDTGGTEADVNTPEAQTNADGTPKKTVSGIVMVQDTVAIQHLAAISENIAQAVSILQDISDASGAKSRGHKIGSTTDYLQGKTT